MRGGFKLPNKTSGRMDTSSVEQVLRGPERLEVITVPLSHHMLGEALLGFCPRTSGPLRVVRRIVPEPTDGVEPGPDFVLTRDFPAFRRQPGGKRQDGAACADGLRQRPPIA